MIEDSLRKLAEEGRLDKPIVLWGVNGMTPEIISAPMVMGRSCFLSWIILNTHSASNARGFLFMNRANSKNCRKVLWQQCLRWGKTM